MSVVKTRMSSNIEAVYPLSPLQKGLLFEHLRDDGSGNYLEQSIIRLPSDCRSELLAQALQLIIDLHPALRTQILYDAGDEPLQVVLTKRELVLQELELTNLQQAYEEGNKSKLDLKSDPLFQARFIIQGERKYLQLIFHHIIMDGWSVSLILAQLQDLYQALTQSQDAESLLRSYRSQGIDSYQDYIKWLNSKDSKASLGYWKDLLSQVEEGSELPKLSAYRNQKPVCKMAFEQLELEPELYNQLKELALSCSATLSSTVEAALAYFLSCYNASEQIVFGKVVSGRETQGKLDLDQTVGLFINTVPVCANFSKHISFFDLLRAMQTQANQSNDHSYLQLADIQEQVCGQRSLVKLLIAFENYKQHKACNDDETEDSEDWMTISAQEITNYPLVIQIGELQSLSFRWTYNPQIYDAEEILFYINSFRTMLQILVNAPEQPLKELPIPSWSMFAQLNAEACVDYPRNMNLRQIYEEIFERYSEDLAVQDEEMTWTYAELRSRAYAVASYLRSQGLRPGARVGLRVESNRYALLGMLGIIFASCTYVPLDSKNPVTRTQEILDAAAVEYILLAPNLTPLELKGNVRQGTMPDNEGTFCPSDARNLDMLASIIFTSGSTGTPKGVGIRDINIHRLLTGLKNVSLPERIHLLQAGSIAFDLFSYCMFLPLYRGGSVHFRHEVNASALREVVANEGVNHIFLTTALFHYIVDEDPEAFAGLTEVIAGGEKLSATHVERFKEVNGSSIILANGYGPTEATTVSHIYITGDEPYNQVPVGKLVGNTLAYIARGERFMGVGMEGELLLGGDALAAGYINDPERTAEKFVELDLPEGLLYPGQESKVRLYRTGDLCRLLPDGNLAYVSRLDKQIKLRGFRIEIAEIEHALRQVHGVKDAAALVCNENLIAFFVGNSDPDYIRAQAAKTLPSYMLPSQYICLDQLPLTLNRKIDYGKLLSLASEVERTEYEAAESETEEKLAAIFGRILKLDRVSRKVNFFESGGHSLRAMSLVNAIAKEFGIRLQLADIFAKPVLVDLAAYLDEKEEHESEIIPRIERKDRHPLSSAQRRIYILQSMDPDSTQYNIPLKLKLQQRVDSIRMRHALEQLMQRHEMLRIRFGELEGQVYQTLVQQAEPDLELTELTRDFDLECEFKSFVRPFDLKSDKLFRVRIYQGQSTAYLFLDIHHIICDGTSLTLLLDELFRLYEGEELKQERIDYLDFVAWENEHQSKSDKNYWLGRYKNLPPALEIPCNFQRPRVLSPEGAVVNCSWDLPLYQKVKAAAKKYQTSEFIVILACYFITLAKYTPEPDIVVGTTLAGRANADLENMLGMFINTLPLRQYVDPEITVREFICQVRDITLEDFSHQTYPFEDLLEDLDLERDFSRNALIETLFTLQNIEGVDLSRQVATNDEEAIHLGMTKFDLTLTGQADEEHIDFSLEYRSSLFTPDFAESLMEAFTQVAGHALAEDELKIKQVAACASRKNLKPIEVKLDRGLLADRLEKVFSQKANSLALRTPTCDFSYAELDELIAQQRKVYNDHGIRTGDVIALEFTDRKAWVVAILAAIRNGLVFVNLAPNDPPARKEFICREVGAVAHVEEAQDGSGTILKILTDGDQPHLPPTTAYLIFTSGTTGKPKGVLCLEQGILNLASHFADHYRLSEGDCILQFASTIFDASIWEVMCSFLNGLALCVIEEEERLDPEALSRMVSDQRYNIALFPPAIASRLDRDVLPKFKLLLTGGSAADKNWIKHLPENVNYVNAYGPTEATVVTSAWDRENREDDIIPIGFPIKGQTVLIMQGELQVPVGMPGELCIAGSNLAAGYLNRPQLTAEKFVSYQGQILYRSGDLARYLPDGQLEYLGRLDKQVKLRSFRIELGEIESCLREVPGVQNAIVVKQGEGDQSYLAAYYVTDCSEVSEDELKAHLLANLPDYMVPNFYLNIPTIPLTDRGKVDTAALPVPIFQEEQTAAAETEEEFVLAKAMEEVLGVEQVGRNSDFFKLGGDSIKAIRVVSKVRDQGYKISVKDILDARILKRIANALSRQTQNVYEQGSLSGRVEWGPLVGYMVNDWSLAKPEHFNQQMIFDLPDQCNNADLHRALRKLTDKHDILRAVIKDGAFNIRPTDEKDLFIFEDGGSYSDLELLEADMNRLQASLNLQRTLMAVLTFSYQGHKHCLWIIHHILIDAVSWRILAEEFPKALAGEELGPKTASYVRWYEHMQKEADASDEKAYWQEQEAELAELTTLSDLSFETRTASEEDNSFYHLFSPELSALFTSADVHEVYNTKQDDLLLAALSLTLGRKLAICMESHGRPENLDTSSTVGWFTATYPIILDYKGKMAEQLIESKERLRSVPNQGAFYPWLRETSLEAPISYNNLGSISSEHAFNLPMGLGIARENTLPWPYNFSASLINGQLEILFTGPGSAYLFATFPDRLQSLVNFLTQQDTEYKTKSDVTLVDTDDEDLDFLSSLLDE